MSVSWVRDGATAHLLWLLAGQRDDKNGPGMLAGLRGLRAFRGRARRAAEGTQRSRAFHVPAPVSFSSLPLSAALRRSPPLFPARSPLSAAHAAPSPGNRADSHAVSSCGLAWPGRHATRWSSQSSTLT